jgi:hypothetical protein
MAYTVCEGKSDGATDDDAKHGATGAAATDSGADRARYPERDQHGRECHGHAPAGRGKQDRHQREKRPKDEGGCRRSGDGLQLPSETATPMRKLLETPPGDEPEWARAGSGVEKHPRELVDAQEATGAGVAGADGVAAGRRGGGAAH